MFISLDAEQALLGGLLVKNAILPYVAEIVNKSDFASPVHGEIFAAISRRVADGGDANAITIGSFFDDAPEIKPLKGANYLAKLEAACLTVSRAGLEDYANHIAELSRCRQLSAIADNLKKELSERNYDQPVAKVLAEHIAHLERVAPKKSDCVTSSSIINEICKTIS